MSEAGQRPGSVSSTLSGGRREGGDDGGLGGFWKTALQLVGAAAGLVVLFELIGRASMWLRFAALDLPAGRAISVIPREQLLARGASRVAVAVLVGVACVLVLYLIRAALPAGAKRAAKWIAALGLEVALCLYAYAALDLEAGGVVATAALGAVVMAVFLAVAHGRETSRLVALTLASLVALAVLGLGVVHDAREPTKLELALVHLEDGSITSGAYVAATRHDIYIAPDLFDDTYGQIAAIPRDDVALVSLSAPRDFESVAHASRTRGLGSGADRAVAAIEPYLAGWAADPIWRYPPITFLEAESLLTQPGRLVEFVETADGPWRDEGTEVDLDKLVTDARGYAGGPVITEGELVQAVTAPAPAGAREVSRFLILHSGGEPDARAICALLTGSDRRFEEGARYQVRGVVVAAGTITGLGDPKGVFLQCASARTAPDRGD